MPVRISGIKNGICISGQDEERAWAERETAFPLYLQPNSNQKFTAFSCLWPDLEKMLLCDGWAAKVEYMVFCSALWNDVHMR